jgi:aconitase A
MKKEEFKSHFEFDSEIFGYYDLKKLRTNNLNKLPYSIRVLLENLLRNFDNKLINEKDIKELSSWKKRYNTPYEIPYHPARVIMQDFTGIPAIIDLASMCDAIVKEGKSPKLINLLVPVDDETLRYLKETNQEEQAQFVENYTKINMLFYNEGDEPEYTDVLELDLSLVKPCVAGPNKPHQHLF